MITITDTIVITYDDFDPIDEWTKYEEPSEFEIPCIKIFDGHTEECNKARDEYNDSCYNFECECERCYCSLCEAKLIEYQKELDEEKERCRRKKQLHDYKMENDPEYNLEYTMSTMPTSMTKALRELYNKEAPLLKPIGLFLSETYWKGIK